MFPHTMPKKSLFKDNNGKVINSQKRRQCDYQKRFYDTHTACGSNSGMQKYIEKLNNRK